MSRHTDGMHSTRFRLRCDEKVGPRWRALRSRPEPLPSTPRPLLQTRVWTREFCPLAGRRQPPNRGCRPTVAQAGGPHPPNQRQRRGRSAGLSPGLRGRPTAGSFGLESPPGTPYEERTRPRECPPVPSAGPGRGVPLLFSVQRNHSRMRIAGGGTMVVFADPSQDDGSRIGRSLRTWSGSAKARERVSCASRP